MLQVYTTPSPILEVSLHVHSNPTAGIATKTLKYGTFSVLLRSIRAFRVFDR